MTYETITVEKMSANCGAIVSGVDLSKPLSNRQFEEIHAALIDRVVIVFRDQDITPQQEVSFARMFGEPQPSSMSAFTKSKEVPEIDVLEYDAKNPPSVTKDLWHTDFVGTPTPTMGTVLYAHDIPPIGGDTIWVNGMAAWDGLSERMRAYLDGLWAYHDTYQPYSEIERPDMYKRPEDVAYLREVRSTYTPPLHPLVRTHPVSGRKGLFVNESMTTRIKGIDRRESDHILRYLFDHLKTPEFQYRHKWRRHDLAVWDNRVSLHYALFDYTEHRLLHRVVIRGDKPY